MRDLHGRQLRIGKTCRAGGRFGQNPLNIRQRARHGACLDCSVMDIPQAVPFGLPMPATSPPPSGDGRIFAGVLTDAATRASASVAAPGRPTDAGRTGWAAGPGGQDAVTAGMARDTPGAAQCAEGDAPGVATAGSPALGKPANAGGVQHGATPAGSYPLDAHAGVAAQPKLDRSLYAARQVEPEPGNGTGAGMADVVDPGTRVPTAPDLTRPAAGPSSTLHPMADGDAALATVFPPPPGTKLASGLPRTAPGTPGPAPAGPKPGDAMLDDLRPGHTKQGVTPGASIDPDPSAAITAVQLHDAPLSHSTTMTGLAQPPASTATKPASTGLASSTPRVRNTRSAGEGGIPVDPASAIGSALVRPAIAAGAGGMSPNALPEPVAARLPAQPGQAIPSAAQ